MKYLLVILNITDCSVVGDKCTMCSRAPFPSRVYYSHVAPSPPLYFQAMRDLLQQLLHSLLPRLQLRKLLPVPT